MSLQNGPNPTSLFYCKALCRTMNVSAIHQSGSTKNEKPKFPTMLKHTCLQMNNISENFFVEAEILLFFTGHNLIIAASFNHLNYKKQSPLSPLLQQQQLIAFVSARKHFGFRAFFFPEKKPFFSSASDFLLFCRAATGLTLMGYEPHTFVFELELINI